MTVTATQGEIKRTYVTMDQEIEQRARPGFHSVERYCTLVPEENELGSIAEYTGTHELVWPGLYREGVIIHERIFLTDCPKP